MAKKKKGLPPLVLDECEESNSPEDKLYQLNIKPAFTSCIFSSFSSLKV